MVLHSTERFVKCISNIIFCVRLNEFALKPMTIYRSNQKVTSSAFRIQTSFNENDVTPLSDIS